MNRNSIFAILLRSPWWVSGGLAAALFTGARLALPADYELYSFFVALPFFVIAVHTGWQQLRAPSEAGVAATIDAVRAMSWTEFSELVEAAFRRDGYGVARKGGAGADLELVKAGRVTLVSCKRWKVARTGIEPLRELDAARQASEAHECVYISAGEITATARAFALEKNIRLIHDADLARFLPKPVRREGAVSGR